METTKNTKSNNIVSKFFSCGYSKRISTVKEVRATFANNLKKVFYF